MLRCWRTTNGVFSNADEQLGDPSKLPSSVWYQDGWHCIFELSDCELLHIYVWMYKSCFGWIKIELFFSCFIYNA